MSALEREDWYAGALIHDENGEPTWRYRVEPFQRAFFESGMTIAEIEARAGWAGGYFSRAIGLRVHPSGKRMRDGGRRLPTLKRTLSYEMAVRIARALDLDLVEWEL